MDQTTLTALGVAAACIVAGLASIIGVFLPMPVAVLRPRGGNPQPEEKPTYA